MYFGYAFLAFFITVFVTSVVRILMRRFEIVDEPKSAERKIHKKRIALGGGWGIFIGFFAVILILFFGTGYLGQNILPKQILALFFGSLILMIGGTLDDKFNLRPRYQLIAPILASLIIIIWGVDLQAITNPFGGTFNLLNWHWVGWLTLADVLVFIWLMGMMYTTKLCDGLDGLTTGIVGIGAIMIGFLSLQELWYQPDLALVAFVLAGACAGFLLWNWHPAKIFLGEGGSLFLGFMLGGLAIISGGKIATTFLVMGVLILDIARVIIRRMQKHKPIYQGDSEHLHFKLLQTGLSQKQAVLLLYAIAILFGTVALFLQSRQKLIAMLFLLILMLLMGVWLSKHEKPETYEK